MVTIDFTAKQQNFISALTNAIIALQTANDACGQVAMEWNAMAYATGASPTGNNITDAVANQIRPSLNASIINSAIGAIAAVQATVAANAGYLEAMRP
jgi:hypothetical protein